MRKRYPGIKPFSTDENNIFFGREQEIITILTQIQQSNLLVLYGNSGTGKTSLLKAGVIPAIHQEADRNEAPLPEIIQVRFGPWMLDGPTLQETIDLHFEMPENLLDQFGNDGSIWSCLMHRQLEAKRKIPFVVMIDQFEEAMTYSSQDVVKFGEFLSQLIYPTTPVKIQNEIRHQFNLDRNSFTTAELDLLFSSISIKVVIAIATDQLHLLDRLRGYVPSILQRCIELRPLSTFAASQALTHPSALHSTDFVSPIFTYTPEVIDQILNYLQTGDQIDPLQLQLIASFIEDRIAQTGATVVTSEVVGDLDKIVDEFVYDRLKNIPQTEQPEVRSLLCHGLLTNNIRLNMHESQILERYGIRACLGIEKSEKRQSVVS